MSRMAPSAVALALAALAATGCVSTGTFEKKEAEAAKYRADLEAEQARAKKVSEELAKATKDLDGLKADLKALQDQGKAAEADLAAKQAALKAAQDEAARQAAELQALQAQGKATEADLAAKQQALKAAQEEAARNKKSLEDAQAALQRKSAEYEKVTASLQGEIQAGRVEVSELKGKLTVKMKDKILFASGSATVGREGLAALAKVAEALAGAEGKVIRVEGHTDNVPTKGTAWASNWELSTARALAVVRVLQAQGVDPTKLAAAGYGEYQPIAGNDTPEGRSLNRRIEIVLAAAQ